MDLPLEKVSKISSASLTTTLTQSLSKEQNWQTCEWTQLYIHYMTDTNGAR